MKNRKTSYPLTILLQTISTILPIAGVIFMVLMIMIKPDWYGLTAKQWEYIGYAAAFVSFTQWVIFRQPLKKMYAKALQDNEYDEFGMSKKKSYDNLTRKEREAMDMQKTAQMESLLSSSVLKRIIRKGSTSPEKDLEAMIGIHSVKTKTTEMAARMKFEQDTRKSRKKKQASGSNSMSGRHMVFYGSAGTGKTSIARIITGFLYKYGYIKENKCVEIDGNFLKAGEESATKTRLILQKAYGGVLFIDEAYTIMDGSGGYGKEVIATLIKEMEDNRDKLIVILAGYKNDMKRLLDANEGFKSRIKEYLEFPDYTTEEMKEIFVAMAHAEGFVVSEEALENFEIRCAKERKLSSFGNGRTVRNILDETIDRHALNYGKGILSKKESTTANNVPEELKEWRNDKLKFVLCGCDVSTAVNKAVL